MSDSEKKDFAGKNGFTWWIGTVEDRMDPIKLGRVRVRCIGWHNEDKNLLPTDLLPWAQCIFPPNQMEPYAPREGEMVMGFFLDGESAQEPVVFGVFPKIPLRAADPAKGFNDPRKDEELTDAPRPPESKSYTTDGSGIVITEKSKADSYPNLLDEPTTPRIARNDLDTINQTFIQERKDNIVKEIPKAFEGTWDEKETAYNAKYPYNDVQETESGHLVEFDDTPGAERIHLAHRNGTFVEMMPDGDQVQKITKDNYQIVMGNDFVYIMGDCNITVQGEARVYVMKDAFVQVDKNANILVKEDVNYEVSGNYNLNVAGDVKINGSTINLNKGSQGAARIGDSTLDNDTEQNGPDTGEITSGSGTVFIGG